MTHLDLQFVLKTFSQLDNDQLYQILQLRSEVFVLEQNCAYQDIDGSDQQAQHLLVMQNMHLIGYARIMPPACHKDEYASIGRVVIKQKSRQHQLGQQLMQQAINHTLSLYPDYPIKISAQTYLSRFYQNLGFVNTGVYYLEDDIPHQEMLYQGSS